MRSLPTTLAAVSVLLALIGAWCIGYSVIDKFTGRQYGNVTAAGSVSRLPEYDAWARKNDTRTYWGLIVITIGGVGQIASIYIPSRRNADHGASKRRVDEPEELQRLASDAAAAAGVKYAHEHPRELQAAIYGDGTAEDAASYGKGQRAAEAAAYKAALADPIEARAAARWDESVAKIREAKANLAEPDP